MKRREEKENRVVKNIKDICFLVQKYSYVSKYGFCTMKPHYCLRFIDEPARDVSKKLKKGGVWHFTLCPAYESGLIDGTVLESLKELEALNVRNDLDGCKEDEELSKILLKFGLAGLDVKYVFTELDDKVEEIREISNNKILYSAVGDRPISHVSSSHTTKTGVGNKRRNGSAHRVKRGRH